MRLSWLTNFVKWSSGALAVAAALACATNLVLLTYCWQVDNWFSIEVAGGVLAVAFDPDNGYVPASCGGTGYWTYEDWGRQVRWTFAENRYGARAETTYGRGVCVYIPLWMIFVPSATVCLLVRRRKRHLAAQCTKCGYDLTGNLSGRCPECGTERAGAQVRPAQGQDVDGPADE